MRKLSLAIVITLVFISAAHAKDSFERKLTAQIFGIAAFHFRSDQMSPSIKMDDRVWVNLRAYQEKSPQVGDVVLVHPAGDDRVYFKRMIGFAPGPGQKFLLKADSEIEASAYASTEIKGKAVYIWWPILRLGKVV